MDFSQPFLVTLENVKKGLIQPYVCDHSLQANFIISYFRFFGNIILKHIKQELRLAYLKTYQTICLIFCNADL